MVENQKKMDAGRLVMCVVLALLFGLFAEKTQAQELYQVTSTREDKALKAFVIEGKEVEMKANVLVFNKVSESPGSYLICYQEGLTPSEDFLTVSNKNDVSRTVVEVDSVGRAIKGNPLVFFTDGSTFEGKDSVFFALQPGQKIEFTEISGLTQNFFRVRTVPRDTPVSKRYGQELISEEQKILAAVQE